jgi:sugar/nucleoside kinase (ribokinase family)
MNIRDASGNIAVWGEPTMTRLAVCGSAFVRDGSVEGQLISQPGGSAYATAIGCAHLGADVVFTGPFGEDESGTVLAEYARGRGVELCVIPYGRSRETVIVVDTDASRSMVSDLGDSFTAPHAARITELPSSTILHVSLSSLVRDVSGETRKLIERSRRGRLLSIDAGSVGAVRAWWGSELSRFFAEMKPDVVFANADEAHALLDVTGGTPDGVGVLVTKHGGEPAEAWNVASGERVLVDAPVGVVALDTTGAGDAFAAGFLAMWSQGVQDVGVLLEHGHAYARRCVEQYGTVVPVLE